MVVIKKENITVIPMDINSFVNSIIYYKKYIKYSKEYTITERLFEELIYELNTTEGVIVVDLSNIISYPSRIFSKLSEVKKTIILCNITTGKLRNMIEEDVLDFVYHDNYQAFVLNNGDNFLVGNVLSSVGGYRKEYEKEIIKSLIDAGECLLESSGLISNYFVNTKKLFYNVHDLNYLLFNMATMVNEEIKAYSIDAFVSTSKNGAVLACLLAGLLDVKEVHLIGVGPKYAMELGDSVECIKKKKRYAYIFDFMCTGTEMKIVSALINAKEAFMPYAAGIARYSGTNASSLITKIDVLEDTESLEIDYKIYGNSK